ncbi:MAG: hypothetical protein LAP38_07010 [Acidobacteriia bacterium]|nr:hypothetical protein [Terriglobia bacterium]
MRISIHHCSAALLFLGASLAAEAAPVIKAIQNAASNIPTGQPIGVGGIFVIKGSGLGPADISIASSPFQNTTLSGTSVQVTVGSTTVDALMYYTSDQQVAALLPSNTPTGSGTFKVTYNGQSGSGGHGIGVSTLGIFTIDSTGTGPGIVTFPDYSLVSAAKANPCGGPNTACGAANPGDVLILWATGLGPVPKDDSSSLGQNMTNISLSLFVGGVKAEVSYQGRSGCCIGEDQIVFKVPDNAPLGCSVPLIVQVGGGISNSVWMPVAKGSRDCTPVNAALASVPVEQAVMSGTSINIADITLSHELTAAAPPVFRDHVNFEFFTILRFPPATQPFFVSWIDSQPDGTCYVVPFNTDIEPPLSDSDLVGLDGGTTFTITGPNGSTQVTGGEAGGVGETISATGAFLVPGTYTIKGNGGADIGPFTATTTFPQVPKLTSPTDNASVTRSNGMTVTWNGGEPNGSVRIVVSSAFDNSFTAGRQAFCKAPAKAGTFAVPPYIMTALPVGNFGGIVLQPAPAAVPFTASGVPLGLLETRHDGAGYGYGAGTGSFTLK